MPTIATCMMFSRIEPHVSFLYTTFAGCMSFFKARNTRLCIADQLVCVRSP